MSLIVETELKALVITKYIKKINIVKVEVNLNNSAEVTVILLSATEDNLDILNITIEGQEYNDWGLDDTYLENLILTRLGLTRLGLTRYVPK